LKTFVLDTNVFLHDSDSLKAFADNEVVIPLAVLDELDNAKTRFDEVGRNARAVVRMLDKLRGMGSLSQGVKVDNSIIRVELNRGGNIPDELSVEKVDNRIISTALGLQKDGKRVIVVSKDINLRVKCDVLGLEAEDYDKDKIATDVDTIYGGVKTLFVPSSTINELYASGQATIENVVAYPNQFFILKSEEKESHSGIARFKGGAFKLCCFPKDLWSIIPRNAEQKMAMELLMDSSVKLVTLIGKAGSGKTLLSLASALHHVINEHKVYNRILISRPIQPMGRDLGFLPGSVEEKLAPWMQPLYDNLELLLGADYNMIEMYKEQGIIHVEPLTYIRGRSIPNSFILIDEAQNLSAHEVKTIITRIGENSKIVLTGDIDQVDNPYVDFADNGLTHIVEKFKEYPIAGHITLRKGERSELATLASEIL